MGWEWIIYWISVATVIVVCTIVKRFFLVGGEQVKRIYVFLVCGVSFVPFLGSIAALFAISFMFFGICEGEISPKKHPFSNEKLNNFFLN